MSSKINWMAREIKEASKWFKKLPKWKQEHYLKQIRKQEKHVHQDNPTHGSGGVPDR